MSINEEDTELRDLLLQTLEKNGVLGKIKAELRAGVFLALESQDQTLKDGQKANRKMAAFQSQCQESMLCLNLVHEFLSFFDLDYSSSVFSVEANSKGLNSSRTDLCQKLNIPSCDSSMPVIASLIYETLTKQSESSKLLTTAHLEKAKGIFKTNTTGVMSGNISKETTAFLLSQVCTGFPTYLIEKFVDEELKSGSSQKISWITFSQMYEKLFRMCSSVVSSPQSGNNNLTSSNGEQTDQTTKNDNSILLEKDDAGSANYEGDFNSVSNTSISEDLQGDGLLSSQSSLAQLTEDRTMEESNIDMDYMEDI